MHGYNLPIDVLAAQGKVEGRDRTMPDSTNYLALCIISFALSRVPIKLYEACWCEHRKVQ